MPPRLVAALSVFIQISGFSSLWAEDASPEWFVRAWQTADGLPDNSVSGVAQGPDGYLLVGTNGGVMRFNGIEFSQLPLHNVPDLPSRQVRAMFLDRQGSLWLGMERGPVIRIGEDSFRAFTFDDGVFDEVVTSITDDSEGRLWIAYSNGICLIEDDKVTRFEPAQGIPTGSQATLTCDTGGQVWFSIGGKLGRLSGNGFELVRDFGNASLRIIAAADTGIWITVDSELMKLGTDDQFHHVAGLPDGVVVNAILEDRDHAVWICTQNDGLLRLKGESLQSVTSSNPSVDCITQDRDGNIWAGTIGGGLNLIKPRMVELIGQSGGLPFTSVQSITSDASGRIWAVSHAGRLAFRESKQWKIHVISDGPDLMNCVVADAENRIWLGTRKGELLRIDGGELTRFGTRDGLTGSFVRSLLAAKNGDIWIATSRPDQLYRLRDDKVRQMEYPGQFQALRALAEGIDGTIWAGSSDGYLLRVEGDRLINEKGVEYIPSIRTLHTTPDGSLWIGYAGEGLGHFKEGQYTRITTEEGLYDDYISQIQDDGEGSLWIAANRGLFQVAIAELLEDRSSAPNKLRCRVFERNDGLPSFQPVRNYSPDSCHGPDKRLYFSTSSGIIEARPDMMRKHTLPPQLVLEKVSVDGRIEARYRARSILTPDPAAQQIDLSKADPRLALPPDHDRLVISFAALGLTSPENLGLRYRLNPLDKHWEEPDNRQSVTFTRLPAGDYEFQVIACNSAGIWNEVGASLDIVVHPFFWETWWFRIGGGFLTVIATAGLVFLGLRRKHQRQLRRIAAKRALEQERSRIARDIHDDLGASLTRISLLSQSSSAQGNGPNNPVLDQIQKTARHLMRSMDEVVWAINPEHDTFDDLANYISSYAQDFLSIAGVRCRLEMPIAVPHRPLSSQLRHNLFLAFKEALNNVVKYAEASEVLISLLPEADGFSLKVEDDGKGIDPDAPTDPSRSNSGSGLENMTSRMNEIGASCILSSTLGQGTSVEFKVRYKSRP